MHPRIRFMSLILPLFLYGSDPFEGLNPPPTPAMQKAMAQAKPCSHPAIAEEKFDESFRYGCFCGKNYPDIKDPSLKPIAYLTYSQRKALIARYYRIRPYDDIDAACRQHDICYIYNGGEDQHCNDALYRRLQAIYDRFEATPDGQKPGTPAWRCKILASDMASIFKTIFAVGDNIPASRFSIFAMITPFTIANKMVQSGARSVAERSGYPLPHERCMIPRKRARQQPAP